MNWEILIPAVTLVLGVVFGMWKKADAVQKVATEAVELIEVAVDSFFNDRKIDAAEWENLKKEYGDVKTALKALKEK